MIACCVRERSSSPKSKQTRSINSVFAVGVRNLFRVCRWSPEFIPWLPLESGIYSVVAVGVRNLFRVCRWSPEFIPCLPLESGIYSVFAVGVRNLFRVCRWSPEFIPCLPLESGIYSVETRNSSCLKWNKFCTKHGINSGLQNPKPNTE